MNDTWKKLFAAFVLIASLVIVIGAGLVSTTLVWFVLGVLIILFFLNQKQYRRNLLTVSIFGLLLGWRGIDFSPSFIVYPTELFIWFGFLIFLADKVTNRNASLEMKLKKFEFGLAGLAIVGMVTAWNYGLPIWDRWASFKSFIVFIPMLILFRNWVHDKSEVQLYASLLVLVGLLISIMGIVERYLPAVDTWFPSIMSGTTESRYNFGFGSSVELAAFNAWGTPVVSTFLAMVAGLAAFQPRPKMPWSALIQFFILPLLILGIIAAGYRSAWLGLGLILFIMILFQREKVLPMLVWTVPATAILFTSAYLDRLKTIFYVFGSSQDSSFLRRGAALQAGLQVLRDHPLSGIGWGAPTTFNDWINVGVAMGLPGLLLLAVGYGWLLFTLMKCAWHRKEPEQRLLYLAFFSSLAGYAVAMVSGAMSQVFPIMTGFWFVFCLAYRLVEITFREESSNEKAVGITADV